jgi:isoleucyl-tRNA synthetase
VTIAARGAAAELLRGYRDDLPMLLIVSQVELAEPSGDGPDVEVTVARAAGEKCARCWRVVPALSSDPVTAGVCDRCVAALGDQGALTS